MDSPTPQISVMLADGLAVQRKAYRDDPVPTLAARRQDLRTLRRFVSEHTEALCAAISADYGHRPRQETLFTEIVQIVQGIDHALKHLRGWAAPQRRPIVGMQGWYDTVCSVRKA